jgi:hypothetical protein
MEEEYFVEALRTWNWAKAWRFRTKQELKELIEILDLFSDIRRVGLSGLSMLLEQAKQGYVIIFLEVYQKNREKVETKIVWRCREWFTRTDNEEMEPIGKYYRIVCIC